MRINLPGGLAAGSAPRPTPVTPAARPTARRSWPVMGTQVSLLVSDATMADEASRIAGDVLSSLDARFSSYRADSEVRRFAELEREARSAGLMTAHDPSRQPPSRDLRHVLAACAWLADVSDGVFSDHPNGTDAPLDVAGYVKGWAVDRAADGLLAAGIDDFALGVGGDWRTSGQRTDGAPWRLGITDPIDPRRTVATVEPAVGAMATSGTYARGQHLHRPLGRSTRLSAAATATDEARPAPASFSVTGPHLAWADAFATIGFLLGDEGLAWVSRFAGYDAALLRSDGTLAMTEHFPLLTADQAPIGPWPRLRAPYGTAA